MMEFEEAFELASRDGRIQLPRTRARSLWDAAKSAVFVEGVFVECGVYRGGSARLIAEVIRGEPLSLHSLYLFDTFEGFSGTGPQDREEVKDGRMFYSAEAEKEVSEFVGVEGVTIVRGKIPDTFFGLGHLKVAFAHLDVDLYKPIRDSLVFTLNRLVKGGVIVVDDYRDPDWPGVEMAVTDVVGRIEKKKIEIEVEATQARIRAC